MFLQFGCQKEEDEAGYDSESKLNWVSCSGNSTDSTNYYVSTSGNDDNSGTKQNEAFQTIYKAIKKVKPGGMVRILKP